MAFIASSLCKQVYKDFIPRKTMDLLCQIMNKPMPHLIRSWNKCCVALYKFWSLWTLYHTYQLQYSRSSYNPDHFHNVNGAVSWGFPIQLKEQLQSKKEKPNPSLAFLVYILKLEDSSWHYVLKKSTCHTLWRPCNQKKFKTVSV